MQKMFFVGDYLNSIQTIILHLIWPKYLIIKNQKEKLQKRN